MKMKFGMYACRQKPIRMKCVPNTAWKSEITTLLLGLIYGFYVTDKFNKSEINININTVSL